MVELLNELGVDFVYRRVNRDPSAMREWEQLDGERVPLLRVGKNSIVRGLDRIKVQQLIGSVGSTDVWCSVHSVPHSHRWKRYRSVWDR